MYWKTLLQLAFPSYVIGLVFLIIIVCERSRRLANLLGKKDPVATLATLILLSYTKFLSIIIGSLSHTVVHYPGRDGPKLVTVWLPDATIEYLKGRHIALFIVALITLFFSVVYTVILFSWQWIQRFSEVKIFRILKFHKFTLFIETYHAPYTPAQRYWTGLLLIIRIILCITTTANVSSDPKVNLLSISVLTVSLLLLKGFTRVYKKFLVEVLEVVCYTNLALLSIASFMVLGKEKSRAVATTVSVSITFLLLVAVLTYHFYSEVLSKLRQKFGRKAITSSLDDSTRATTDASAQKVTHSILDGPKRSSDDGIGLRELLLSSSKEH